MKCSKDYLGDSLPPLITNMKESHSEVRAYMIDVMRERVGGTQKALTHASDNFYEHLKNNGEGSDTEAKKGWIGVHTRLHTRMAVVILP